jgi:signal transduction histidine kinase/putative methionine-R-sulfoxide reductase with GAF domain
MSQNPGLGKFDSISAALRQIQPLLAQITQATSLQEMADGIYFILQRDFNFTSTGFYFINPETKKLELMKAQGLTEDEVKEAQGSAMERHPGWVIRNRKTFLSNGNEVDQTNFQKRLHLVSRLYCPVIFQGECIGTIGVASSEPNAFNDNHVAFIEFLCQIAAVTYENITNQIELAKNRERLEQAVSSLKFGIWDWDMEKGDLYWDDYMYTLFESKKEDFSGYFDAFQKTFHPDDELRVSQALRETFEKRGDLRAEFRIITKAGKVKRISASAKCTYSPEGKILRLVGANWDVTEEREKEMQLFQASKMSSLGEMSAGIAHEINNPLAIIQGKSYQVRKIATSDSVDREQVVRLTEDIDRTVQRISKIVKGLRSFSRDGDKDPFEKKSLKTIVDETLSFCMSRFANHGVAIEVSEIPETMMIECRPTSISQVLLNILNNAFDAIEKLDHRWVRIELEDRGSQVVIRLIDSGPGIREDLRAKILEPFFTTKEVGKGTGLGLSIAHGIIRAHNGKLEIDSQCPNTCFQITLPKYQTA